MHWQLHVGFFQSFLKTSFNMPKDHSSSIYNGRGMRVYNAPVYHGAVPPVRRPGGNARRCYRCQLVGHLARNCDSAWYLRHRRWSCRRCSGNNNSGDDDHCSSSNSRSNNNSSSGGRGGAAVGEVVLSDRH